MLRDGEVDAPRPASGARNCGVAGLPAPGWPGLTPIGTPELGEVRRLDDNLVVLDSGAVACVHCGTEIGPLAGGAFVASLARREAPPTEAGPHIWHDPLEYVDAEIVFRQLCCPGCLTAAHSRVVPVDHPSRATNTGTGTELRPARKNLERTFCLDIAATSPPR